MSVAQAANDVISNKKAALKGLYDDLYGKNMFPFWATSEGVDHDEIKQLMATNEGGPLRLVLFRHRAAAAARRRSW